MLTFFFVVALVVGGLYLAYQMFFASQDVALAEEWARHLTYEQADAAHSEGRSLMIDYFVDPRRCRVGEATRIKERAVAAKGRMNQLTGQPYGPSFRVQYRGVFVRECAEVARAVHDSMEVRLRGH